MCPSDRFRSHEFDDEPLIPDFEAAMHGITHLAELLLQTNYREGEREFLANGRMDIERLVDLLHAIYARLALMCRKRRPGTATLQTETLLADPIIRRLLDTLSETAESFPSLQDGSTQPGMRLFELILEKLRGTRAGGATPFVIGLPPHRRTPEDVQGYLRLLAPVLSQLSITHERIEICMGEGKIYIRGVNNTERAQIHGATQVIARHFHNVLERGEPEEPLHEGEAPLVEETHQADDLLLRRDEIAGLLPAIATWELDHEANALFWSIDFTGAHPSGEQQAILFQQQVQRCDPQNTHLTLQRRGSNVRLRLSTGEGFCGISREDVRIAKSILALCRGHSWILERTRSRIPPVPS